MFIMQQIAANNKMNTIIKLFPILMTVLLFSQCEKTETVIKISSSFEEVLILQGYDTDGDGIPNYLDSDS